MLPKLILALVNVIIPTLAMRYPHNNILVCIMITFSSLRYLGDQKCGLSPPYLPDDAVNILTNLNILFNILCAFYYMAMFINKNIYKEEAREILRIVFIGFVSLYLSESITDRGIYFACNFMWLITKHRIIYMIENV